MYTGNIQAILAIYKKHFSEIATIERAKWHTILHFQTHWDLEDPDFSGMFTRALPASRQYNILDKGPHYTPLANLRKMVQLDPDRVREWFRDLFSDDFTFEANRRLFRAKLNAFETQAKSFHHEMGLAAESYMDDRAVLFLLTLRHPDLFCLYRPIEFNKIYPLAGLPFLHAGSSTVDHLVMYLVLWQYIRQEIAQDFELQEMARSLLAPGDYTDPDWTVLAQDVLVAVSRTAFLSDPNLPLMTSGPVGRLHRLTRAPRKMTFAPSGHCGQNDIRRYVPVKQVCDLEQREINLRGFDKTADSFVIFHGCDAGFDVLSYDRDGREKYVLVKVIDPNDDAMVLLNEEEINRLRKSPHRCWVYLIDQYDPDTATGSYWIQPI